MKSPIRIPKWATFQHYKNKTPAWIKLHRTTLNSRDWHELSGDAAKLLIELWLVAAESPEGIIAAPTQDLAWRLRRPYETFVNLLVELERHNQVELAVRDADTAINTHPTFPQPPPSALDQKLEVEVRGRGRGEESKENTARASVEKPDYSKPPEYTKGELVEAARKVCGLGMWSRDEENRAHSILTTWYGEGKRPGQIWAAIHGARMLCDAGKINWLPAGKPFGLRALRNTGMLFDQGDGMAARPFFYAAEDAYYADGDKPTGARGGGPKPIAEALSAILEKTNPDGGFAA